jgi:mono-ADP-ribosyltransferase sirtuin 6
MCVHVLNCLGRVQFIISTNMDGLHMRSGMPAHMMVELHGNIYKESCERCQKEYYRPFEVRHVCTLEFGLSLAGRMGGGRGGG